MKNQQTSEANSKLATLAPLMAGIKCGPLAPLRYFPWGFVEGWFSWFFPISISGELDNYLLTLFSTKFQRLHMGPLMYLGSWLLPQLLVFIYYIAFLWPWRTSLLLAWNDGYMLPSGSEELKTHCKETVRWVLPSSACELLSGNIGRSLVKWVKILD